MLGRERENVIIRTFKTLLKDTTTINLSSIQYKDVRKREKMKS
jgi:hypothetical protein